MQKYTRLPHTSLHVLMGTCIMLMWEVATLSFFYMVVRIGHFRIEESYKNYLNTTVVSLLII